MEHYLRYKFNLTLAGPFDQAQEKVRKTPMPEHLRILSDVDIQVVSKARIDRDIPAYYVLGARNPKLAGRVIGSKPNAGTLLPCNFILPEDGAGTTVVSFMGQVPLLAPCETEEPKAVAEEVRDMLQRQVQEPGA